MSSAPAYQNTRLCVPLSKVFWLPFLVSIGGVQVLLRLFVGGVRYLLVLCWLLWLFVVTFFVAVIVLSVLLLNYV